MGVEEPMTWFSLKPYIMFVEREDVHQDQDHLMS